MADKKLFPGVTEGDLQKKRVALEKAAEQQRIVLEKTEQKKERTRLHKLYNPPLPLWIKIALIAALNFVVGAIHTFTDSEERYDVGMRDYPFSKVLMEAYIPTYHYSPGSIFDEPWEGYKSEPNRRWVTHMLLLLSEAVVLSMFAMVNRQRNKQIDIMAEFARLSKEQKIDEKYIKRILEVAPDIVTNMSKDSRVYFDMLMEGKFDIEKTPGLLDVTTAVMQGHLQSHPEDLQMVLDIFDERSIPEQIKLNIPVKGR